MNEFVKEVKEAPFTLFPLLSLFVVITFYFHFIFRILVFGFVHHPSLAISWPLGQRIDCGRERHVAAVRTLTSPAYINLSHNYCLL